jgi:hypothetical protein
MNDYGIYRTRYTYTPKPSVSAKRQETISKDDILNVIIAVESCKDVNDFIDQL